jgi:5-deoxy-glucuronate isomerase
MTIRSGLLVKPTPAPSGPQLELTPAVAGWELIGLTAVKLAPGESWDGLNDGVEGCLVVLQGTLDAQVGAETFTEVGGRESVFDGPPHALYVPVTERVSVVARSPLEFAYCTAKADRRFPAVHVRPEDVEVELRGDANALRQIHHILAPGFPAHRLLIVEVFTPSGNWSSYPPHKHDAHEMPGEADLEEIYYYRTSRPEGYAIQRVYSGDGGLDETLTVRDGEVVLIPEGYHPVVAPPGYDVYYLNVLSGSARSMAATDDPAYGWVRGTWRSHAGEPPLFPRRN